MQKTYEEFIKDVHHLSGVDLSAYKRPQMERRINNLMRTVNIENYTDYVSFLRNNKAHYEKFLTHITINVSEFFRNPQQWYTLRDKILPNLISPGASLKIWSAGCSTGEEPYSLAILLSEYFPKINFRITATDLDKQVLQKAQEGIYYDKALINLPDGLEKKYFNPVGDKFQVKPQLRQNIQFSNHNLLKDSFGTSYDLILCRNVVIYFTEETKNHLYLRFNEALRQGGILFIGSTEQIFNARTMGLNPMASFFYQKA